MTYDTIIFDMDGVLVPNSPRWVFDQAATQALVESGVEEPTKRDLGFLKGFPTDLRTAEVHFTDNYGLDFETVWRRRERFASVNQLGLMRSEKKAPFTDIGVLAELDATLAIVSNNQHATVESVVRHSDLEQHVQAWFGLEPTLKGIRKRKPDPWYLEMAQAEIDGENTLYVGDKESDVVAATRAGMDSALISRSGNPINIGPKLTHNIESLTDIPTLADDGGVFADHERDENVPAGRSD